MGFYLTLSRADQADEHIKLVCSLYGYDRTGGMTSSKIGKDNSLVFSFYYPFINLSQL